MDSSGIIAIIKRKKNELEESLVAVGPNSDAETRAAAIEVASKAQMLDEILEEIASADMQGVRESSQPERIPSQSVRPPSSKVEPTH